MLFSVTVRRVYDFLFGEVEYWGVNSVGSVGNIFMYTSAQGYHIEAAWMW